MCSSSELNGVIYLAPFTHSNPDYFDPDWNPDSMWELHFSYFVDNHACICWGVLYLLSCDINDGERGRLSLDVNVDQCAGVIRKVTLMLVDLDS